MSEGVTYLNPLRDPEDRRLPRIAGPCGLVIFGVTGDLSRKKLMPTMVAITPTKPMNSVKSTKLGRLSEWY